MDLVISDMPGVTKAVLSGRLDTANVNRLESEFNTGVLEKAQATVLDLTRVTFIASLGIRMLLSISRDLGREGAKFALFGASPAVMEIFESAALSDIISIHTNEADALADVRG